MTAKFPTRPPDRPKPTPSPPPPPRRLGSGVDREVWPQVAERLARRLSELESAVAQLRERVDVAERRLTG